MVELQNAVEKKVGMMHSGEFLNVSGLEPCMTVLLVIGTARDVQSSERTWKRATTMIIYALAGILSLHGDRLRP